MTPALFTYSAVFVADGHVRRMTFQARDLAEATAMAARWGVGVEGLAVPAADAPPPPVAVPLKTARVMLGGVSRGQVYIWLTIGRLARMPDTRRVLITLESIDRFKRKAA